MIILDDLKYFLEKLDHYRDEFLFLFIKPYWPRIISPNCLTYIRIVIGLALFVMLFFLGIENKLVVVSLFCIGAITDLFDGSVARGLNKVTGFGTMLDPVADRILIMPIAIYSLIGSHRWLLLWIILVEIIGAVVSVYQESNGIHLASNIFGKTKMVLLSLVFVAILIYWPNEISVVFTDVIWVSLIFSILSIFIKILDLKKQGFIKNKIANKQLIKQ